MTSRQWRDIQIKLKLLRSMMETGKHYQYIPNCTITSEGVDRWIDDAFSCRPCRGSCTWQSLMKDLNAVYKMIKEGK